MRIEPADSRAARDRVDERIRAWRIDVERVSETDRAILAFGQRDSQPVVLKVARSRGDEWRSGEILDAFDGRGVVRVYEHGEGAVLLERLVPGHSLADTTPAENDDQATAILADVMRKMAPRSPPAGVPTVQDRATSFERYAASGDHRIPPALVTEAQRAYAELCQSHLHVRLLHGDLHHHNVLYDSERGWLAVDPKGVIGELEFEIGTALRNPVERQGLFTDPSVIHKRVERFVRELNLDGERMLAWAFAQAVLAAIWEVEDGTMIDPQNGFIRLAQAIRQVQADRGDLSPFRRTRASAASSTPRR